MIIAKLVVVAAFVIALAGCSDPCSNTIVSRIPSPDTRHDAIVFQRDCGATTDTSLQVSIVDPEEAPADIGNAFRSDGNVMQSGAGGRSNTAVEARWHSSGELVVRYNSALRIFSQEPEAHGIRTTYQPFDAEGLRRRRPQRG